MKICFIRHGETDYNKSGRIQGSIINPSLNNVGVKQAWDLAHNLPDFDFIFSSPLKRTVQTARVIHGRLKVPIILRDELAEKNHGALAGLTWDEISEIFNGEKTKEELRMKTDFSEYSGETVENTYRRANEFLEFIKKYYSGFRLVAVTHAGVIRHMHHIISGEDRDVIKNTSLHEFEI